MRGLIDMAEHMDNGYVPMKEVAKRQEIIYKYLERILPILVKKDLLRVFMEMVEAIS